MRLMACYEGAVERARVGRELSRARCSLAKETVARDRHARGQQNESSWARQDSPSDSPSPQRHTSDQKCCARQTRAAVGHYGRSARLSHVYLADLLGCLCLSGGRSDVLIPDDVLLCIFDSRVPKVASWDDMDQVYSCFNSLSLMSKAVHELVDRVRYKYLLVRTPDQAQDLLDNSSRGLLDKIRKKVRAITIGPRHSSAAVPGCQLAELSAAVGGGGGVTEFSTCYVQLNKLSFWAIRHSQYYTRLSF